MLAKEEEKEGEEMRGNIVAHYRWSVISLLGTTTRKIQQKQKSGDEVKGLKTCVGSWVGHVWNRDEVERLGLWCDEDEGAI